VILVELPTKRARQKDSRVQQLLVVVLLEIAKLREYSTLFLKSVLIVSNDRVAT
jgi:hypothetical protein